ncbi:hypothetical protein [Bacillus piscicola]|uniref:hypothetical protein n=1 Tax=Bacillus piscicola TaxID=1632684 RepID=UPI001F097016|nr:hypothetical protein [Bacillus piscicola]
MNMALFLWIIVGGIVGFAIYGPPGILIGVMVGLLLRISEQLSVIVEDIKKGKGSS